MAKMKMKVAKKKVAPRAPVEPDADDGMADTPKAIAKSAAKARAKRLAGYQL